MISKPPVWMRDWPLFTGTLASILSMFFGASGPFVNTYVKAQSLAVGTPMSPPPPRRSAASTC